MPIQQSLLFDFDNEPVLPQKIVEEKVEAEIQEPIELVLVDPRLIEAEEVVEETVSKSNTRLVAGTGKKIGRGRLKMSDIDAIADLIQVPEDEELFSKKYYSIGNVAEMFKVNVSLIRFWENEFPALKPKKNGKGDRLFRPEDVKTLKLIHHLLREKKFTIDGAKDFLKKNKRAEANFEMIEMLKKTKQFLTEIKLSL